MFAVGVVPVTADLKPQHHVVPDGTPFKQLIPLGHKAHPSAGAGDRCTAKRHRAAVQRFQTRKYAQQCGFSAAGGAHDADKFPLCHIKGYAPQRLHLAVAGLICQGGIADRDDIVHIRLISFIKPRGGETLSLHQYTVPGRDWFLVDFLLSVVYHKSTE